MFKGYEDHLVFGSNPCRCVCVGGVRRRIRVLSQEVCVFRDALVDRLAKNRGPICMCKCVECV